MAIGAGRTWPGSRSQLPRLASVPIQLIWAPEDQVFPIEYARRLKELLPHAQGPKTYDKAAHFLQDDRGPEIAADLVAFLNHERGAQPVNFVTPTPEELAGLRADPIIFEQELDVRPEVASSLERALGFRAGRAYLAQPRRPSLRDRAGRFRPRPAVDGDRLRLLAPLRAAADRR